MKPCPHKLLRKQMSGMQVWYVCDGETKHFGTGGMGRPRKVGGCGQKFKAQEWDGRVKVVKS